MATMVYNSLGHRGPPPTKPFVCKHWLAGICTRNPCKFLHPQTPANHPRIISTRETIHDLQRKTPRKICDYWVFGNCVHGQNCRFLHSWSESDGAFSMLTRLEGHKKAVNGVTLPAGSDKLFSGGGDGTLRIWDCYTGKCDKVTNHGCEIGCLINEESWVIIGLPNLVKVWNVSSGKESFLEGPVGQVYGLVTRDDLLFAGAQDGAISVWKYNSEAEITNNPFVFVTSLQGHTKPVVSLVVGKGMLYSSSMDCTIRIWDEELRCVEILRAHSNVVMSVLCWEDYLLSCSLDRTVLVWAATKDGSLEVIYTHREEEGILAMFGMMDAEGKPVLYCSCKDNSVRLYDLPSFAERGMIFARKEIRVIQEGPAGLFFTGDATGALSVWQWQANRRGEDS